MYGFSGNYLWTIIILILIVLQWFRVGWGEGSVGPESGFVNNGGLFIITLFILVACSCFKGYGY